MIPGISEAGQVQKTEGGKKRGGWDRWVLPTDGSHGDGDNSGGSRFFTTISWERGGLGGVAEQTDGGGQ